MKYLTIKSLKEFQAPIVGFGTPHSAPKVVEDAVLKALESGYRLLDTAFMYDNEVPVGAAIKKWINDGKGKREDLFITTKLPLYGNRASDVKKYLKMSLQRLQLDYLDLYLIHSPLSLVCDECSIRELLAKETEFAFDNPDSLETWKAMEKQVQNGLTRAIGLSNFNAAQVEKIYNTSAIKPAVLQIEMHAYLQQKELLQFCNEHNIVVTAFSPLGRPDSRPPFVPKCILMNNLPAQIRHPVVNKIASKYNKSSAQILLKHLVQQNVMVIPRSCIPHEIEENLEIFDFELSAEDMLKLDGLDQGENGRSIDYQFLEGVEQQPQYPFKKAIRYN